MALAIALGDNGGMAKLTPEQRRLSRERAIELQLPICPYCGKTGINTAVHGDHDQQFVGLCGHQWAESDLQEVQALLPKPHWLCDSWKWIGEHWKWDAILSVGAYGMIRLGEYGLAVALLVVAGI